MAAVFLRAVFEATERRRLAIALTVTLAAPASAATATFAIAARFAGFVALARREFAALLFALVVGVRLVLCGDDMVGVLSAGIVLVVAGKFVA